MDTTRVCDIFFSAIALLILAPFLLIIGLVVLLTSKGPAIYVQVRVGKNNTDFKMYKFRTMRPNASKQGQLTIGSRDNRITGIGYFLRKFKLDELPQLYNVLRGDMSIVGPRPEVRKYVNLYKPDEMFVLSVRPGITDYASISYKNENELLAKADDPEKFYIEEVMPAKITLNKHYIYNRGLRSYFFIIFRTILTVFNP